MAEKRFSQNRSFIFFEKLKFIHLRVNHFTSSTTYWSDRTDLLLLEEGIRGIE